MFQQAVESVDLMQTRGDFTMRSILSFQALD